MAWYFEVINRYASNLMFIFMNIDKDIRNKSKIYRKMNKISYTSAAKWLILPDVVPD